jgi:hypothetical protein
VDAVSRRLALLIDLPDSGKLGMAAQLACWRQSGRFPDEEADIAPAVVGHLAAQAGVTADVLEGYEWTGWVVAANRFRNPDDDLSADALAFTATLKAEMAEALVQFDAGPPRNGSVRLAAHPSSHRLSGRHGGRACRPPLRGIVAMRVRPSREAAPEGIGAQ